MIAPCCSILGSDVNVLLSTPAMGYIVKTVSIVYTIGYNICFLAAFRLLG